MTTMAFKNAYNPELNFLLQNTPTSQANSEAAQQEQMKALQQLLMQQQMMQQQFIMRLEMSLFIIVFMHL